MSPASAMFMTIVATLLCVVLTFMSVLLGPAWSGAAVGCGATALLYLRKVPRED